MSITPAHHQVFLPDRAPSVRTARHDTARARWRLRAIQSEIAEFGPDADPELARVTEELDLLETASAARP